MSNGHLTNELITAYATGAAREGVALAAAAHLTYCADCRRRVEARETVAGALLASAPGAQPADIEQLMGRLDETEVDVAAPFAGPLPAPVAAAIGVDFDKIPWRFRLPGVYEYEFSQADGDEISLMKVHPGSAIPSHTHEAEELTVVFKGELQDGVSTYSVGDISVADPSVDHNPRAGGDTACICLAVLSGGVKFTGPLGRALNLFS